MLPLNIYRNGNLTLELLPQIDRGVPHAATALDSAIFQHKSYVLRLIFFPDLTHDVSLTDLRSDPLGYVVPPQLRKLQG